MGWEAEEGYWELLKHREHKIVIACYGDPDDVLPDNIAIECEDCSCVLLSYNRWGEKE